MLRINFPALILLATSAVIQAQVPMERPEPLTAPSTTQRAPMLTGVSVWPQTRSIKPGTRLLITTLSEPNVPFSCRMRTLTADELTCAEGHGETPETFDRIVVGSIALPAKRSVRISTIVTATGGACLLVAYLIATHAANNGGSANGNLAEAGLTLVVGGLVTRGYERARDPEPRYQTPIYIAPNSTYSAAGN